MAIGESRKLRHLILLLIGRTFWGLIKESTTWQQQQPRREISADAMAIGESRKVRHVILLLIGRTFWGINQVQQQQPRREKSVTGGYFTCVWSLHLWKLLSWKVSGPDTDQTWLSKCPLKKRSVGLRTITPFLAQFSGFYPLTTTSSGFVIAMGPGESEVVTFLQAA